ncbi:MAG: glycoside hydrolase family 15 protein [Anaerosomatales bacterium]|nr:glycoside hydrolase family 15 protein [Anaerosomatales bacterium]MDT8434592.1 glycoside hydrolase family 15 protein [Anaerosomatales bacterium]
MTRIEDYAFLSDCQSAALVSIHGSVDWLCFPRFDSPSVFGRLLDPDAGTWTLAPTGEHRTVRDYLPDSLVLRTEHVTPTGTVEVLDALLFEPGAREHDIGMRVPHELVRVVRGVVGSVEIETQVEPCLEYGLTRPRIEPTGSGFRARGGPVELVLSADVALECTEHGAHVRFAVGAGEEIGFRLAFARMYGPGNDSHSGSGSGSATTGPTGAAAAIADTEAAWRSWVDMHSAYEGPYADSVRRSALILQGLTYQPSGALVAAATTSLPERVGGEWNWDYRYTWLRDASLTLNARWVSSCPHEPWRFFRWIENAGSRTGESPLQIMYDVEGGADLTEHTLDHLRGFADSRPVRVGNDAWTQTQLDVAGEILDAAFLMRHQMGKLSAPTRAMLVRLADDAAARWREPDAGMWESRDIPRHYVSSKVMSWVALDRAVLMADLLDAESGLVEAWVAERDAVREAVLRDGWSEEAGAYGGAFGSSHLDASVLLMPIVGFLPADDERMLATIHAIDERLGRGGLVRRWAEEPNAFLICSYWLIQCLALAGERERAEEYFEAVTAHANDVGLLAEMVDMGTGDLLGNTPQAFSHIGLINSAWTLSGNGLPE